ncbi:MAG TPA: sulfatase-like hydrolase/transferase, partial [Thermoanaerobaculia bacterium]|nr:sulfatase-like hydrolase/transferase [Thermoanaerobaculia bacterium]
MQKRRRNRRAWGVLLVSCALPLLFSACGRWRAGHKGKPWNVLIVTFDTTRADHIGCYGNKRIKTPTLDGLAREGVRFARALTAVPITAPSHTTIMTGRYPIAHGVRDNGLFKLAPSQLTLAEMLKAHGYDTAAAIGGYPLIARFGLNQGFDLYDDHLTGRYEDYRGERVVPKHTLFFDERRAAQVNEAVMPWLKRHAESHDGKPFFVWVHYFDPHQPFDPPPPYNELYADNLYDGEIAYADSRLGFLLNYLKKLGELDRTLVVMVADHGEGLSEHNEVTHAILAYNSTLHVPLIIRPPGDFPFHGTVINHWVGTVDIVPTILDLLGYKIPDTVQGHSLVPLWTKNKQPSRWLSIHYAENLSPRLTHGWGELRVLVEGPMKYIFGPRQELYNIDKDPHELHNLIAERPDVARRMHKDLQGFLRRWSVPGASTTEAMGEDVRRRLESLGYLQGPTPAAGTVIVERLRSDGIPPQERVGDINDLSAAKHLLYQGKGIEALPYTETLLRRDPDSTSYIELNATALLMTGHPEQAWKVAQRAPAGSLSDDLVLHLSESEFDSGDRTGAVEAMKRNLAVRSSAPVAWHLASFYTRLGEREKARNALESALKKDPKFAPARVDLAVWLARSGDDEAAEREFTRALEVGPYYAKAFYNYGAFLLHQTRYA